MSKQATPKRSFQPLDKDPALSPTLPGYLYSDPAVMAEERRRIFYQEWQLVGHVSQLRQAGDYITASIADQKVMVIHDKTDKNRAFFNVCQHRAHELLSGSGNTRNAIVCPYHAWTYRLTGTLRTARGTEKLPNFDPHDFGLTPVRLEEVMGFLFINLDADAPPVENVYRGLFNDMRKTMPWADEAMVLPDVQQGDLNESTLEANWKVLAENCLECYHCTNAHPDFVDLIAIDSYSCTQHGKWQKSVGDLRKNDSKAYWVADDAPVQTASFWHVYPNIQFGCLPGDKVMTAFTFNPEDADRTFLKAMLLAAPGHLPSPERCQYVGEVLWPEDEALCVSVQQGLKSLGYRQGRFVMNPDRPGISENGVHHFQRTYAKAMSLKLGG